VPNAVPSPSTFARAAVRQPPSVVREMAADGARPAGRIRRILDDEARRHGIDV
jgi:hypothetical protein